MGVLRYLPLPFASPLAAGAGRVLDIAVPRLREIARTNLTFAFPNLKHEEREQAIDGVFASIGRMLLSIAKFPSINAQNISEWILYEGMENYHQAKTKGRGILIATGHLGNWELSAFAHALMTEPMNVMVRPLDNSRIDRIVESRRALSGNHLIYKHRSARAVIEALKKNEAVGILIDQNTAAPEGVFIEFFGKRACAGSGFVKLAYHTGAAVLPGFALWDQATRKYILRFFREVQLTGDVEADTQRIHSVVEGVVRQYPDQWMWIHRRWKTQPGGEPQVYR